MEAGSCSAFHPGFRQKWLHPSLQLLDEAYRQAVPLSLQSILVRISIAADHGGLSLKEDLIEVIQQNGHVLQDLGADEYDHTDDYPDFALAVARDVATGKADRGIVICGSGVGAAIAANKVRGARASLCHDTYSARQGVEHDDMNVLCMGARVIGLAVATDVTTSYLAAKFSGEERHQRRLAKVLAAETADS